MYVEIYAVSETALLNVQFPSAVELSSIVIFLYLSVAYLLYSGHGEKDAAVFGAARSPRRKMH